MEVPQSISRSCLYQRIAEDSDLLNAILSIRDAVCSLAATTAQLVPDFTDHTIRHMDALWGVADIVLTGEEIRQLSPAEAFLLTSAFYLHDTGLAYAATAEGLQSIQTSNTYLGFIAATPPERAHDTSLKAQAVAYALRTHHASKANTLAIAPIPGTQDRYIIEKLSFREAWGPTCGSIAESHHWDISKLEEVFGMLGDVPLPEGRKGDLLYVSLCLRLIDYAHINRDRASPLDRSLRSGISETSLLHWLAQEHIDGPTRTDNELIYRSASPISNVEAWWLFYGMMVGLDSEIRAVKRTLEQRKESLKRISLSAVRGAASPEEASKFISTSGFLPIEIDLRTGSIDRFGIVHLTQEESGRILEGWILESANS